MAIIRKTLNWENGDALYVGYDPDKQSQTVELVSDRNMTYVDRSMNVNFTTSDKSITKTLKVTQKSSDIVIGYLHSIGMGDIKAGYPAYGDLITVAGFKK